MLAEARETPRLVARMLRSGCPAPLDSAGFHSQLLFGQPHAPAALSRYLDRPDDASGVWIRADPVGLTPDLGAVWLDDRASLSPESPVVAELIDMFAEEGLEFDLPVAERGYLRLKEEPDCQFFPPWQLAGQSMEHVWPAGVEARRWRRLLNETQVILHQHSCRHVGLPGSLWFWGAGRLPETISTPRVRRVTASSHELWAAAAWAGLNSESDKPAPGTMAGSLLEWPVDDRLSADENLTRLGSWLGGCWRRLRFDRKVRTLELACENRIWRFSTLDAWRPW